MKDNIEQQPKAVMLEASIDKTPELSETNVHFFVRREGSPETTIKAAQNRNNKRTKRHSNTSCRELDHIHSSFERIEQVTPENKNKHTEQPTKIKIKVLPVIDLTELLKKNTSVALEDNINKIVLTQSDIMSIVGRGLIKIKWNEIDDLVKGEPEFGNIPYVKQALVEIIADSSREAAQRTINECKKNALEKTSKVISERAVYFNIENNPGLPLEERIVFLVHTQGNVPAEGLQGSLYNTPYYLEHSDYDLLTVLKIKEIKGEHVFVTDKINRNSLSSSISKLILPETSFKDGGSANEIINTLKNIPGWNDISEISDSQLGLLFKDTIENGHFIASDIYSREILSKKVRKLYIDKTKLKKELSLKIGVRKPSNKISLSDYNSVERIYTKNNRIKNSFLDETLNTNMENITELNKHRDKGEFKGTMGETFNINQKDASGVPAVCSIAAILASSDKNSSILKAKTKKIPTSLEQQIKVVSRRLTPENNETKSLEEVLVYMNTKEGKHVSFDGPDSYTTQYKDETTDPYNPEMFGSGYRFKKIKEFIEEYPSTILGYDMRQPTLADLSRMACSLGIVEETEYRGDRFYKDSQGNNIKVTKEWKEPSDNIKDKQTINIPKVGAPITHAAGTMIDKPGNVTWYYPTRGDRPEQALDFLMNLGGPIPLPPTYYHKNAYYEGDAKFHTLSANYEFFNTKAIRKYMGFAAPFIGPAYDAIQTYAINPNLETKTSTETFADNIREKIHAQYLGTPLEEENTLVTEEPEMLADCVRKYGWLEDIAIISPESEKYMYRETPDDSGPTNCKAPYHNLGPEEYDSFLKPNKGLNSYKEMDRIFRLYLTLGTSQFVKQMEQERPFETDGFNPYTTVSEGYSKYLWRNIREKGFELLPKEDRLKPSMPNYYEDALMFEHIEKKDHNPDNHYAKYGEREKTIRGIEKEDRSRVYPVLNMEGTANLNNLSRPLGIEPYMEPFGSSRTGDFKRPFESLRLLNTLSRTTDELADRNLTFQEEDINI